MYELIQLSEHDYYIDCPSKIGIVRINDEEVIVIDSGNDKDAGKKILKHLEANGWKLRAVYNTHSHADHIGGNKLLQERSGCKIYARGLEATFANYPVLEPIALYGGNPFEKLKSKFLMAQPSAVENLTEDKLPEGFELIELPGHCFEMVGLRTPDNNIFLGDCLSSEETLEKYGIGYLWDPEEYINTLEMVKTLTANAFIPAHAPVTRDITHLADVNITAVKSICEKILNLCEEKISFDELLQKVFESYGLTMNEVQYALIGSTIKSYLSYLHRTGKAEYTFEDNLMLWQKKITEKIDSKV